MKNNTSFYLQYALGIVTIIGVLLLYDFLTKG
jgi:hypothetical protein